MISKSIEIDMGHRVPEHGGHCRHLHGHRYKIEALVENIRTEDKLDKMGMVVDFSVIKRALMDSIHYKYDHKCCLWKEDPLCKYLDEWSKVDMLGIRIIDKIPTAENLAKIWYKDIVRILYENKDMKKYFALKSVTVYETPTSKAIYMES